MKFWIKEWINGFMSNASAWYQLIITLIFMFVSLMIIGIVAICIKKYKSNRSSDIHSHDNGSGST